MYLTVYLIFVLMIYKILVIGHVDLRKIRCCSITCVSLGLQQGSVADSLKSRIQFRYPENVRNFLTM
jgi:hypothetical protein